MDTLNLERRPGIERYSQSNLDGENEAFAPTGGVSRNNRQAGFLPAFQDMETGFVYRSRFSDGNPAPIHLLDGLPKALRLEQQEGEAVTFKPTLVAGFLRANRFYTREQAAQAMNGDLSQPG